MLRTNAMPWLLAIPFVLSGNAKSIEFDNNTLVLFGPGFSAEERRQDTTWRWMAAEGVVKLKNLRQDMTLTIAGSAPLYGLPEPPTMRVFLNGNQLDQFRPPENIFEKEYHVPAAILANDEWSELRITTDKVFVPNEFNKKSSDGRRLGFQLSLLRWGMATGVNEPKTFLPPAFPLVTPIDEQILTLAFSPDGKKLVTAGAFQPGQLKIWDVETAKDLVTIPGIPGVRTVAFSPDGKTLASGHFGGSISLRDLDTGHERTALKGHTLGVNSLAFSRDGTALVSAGLDRAVKLWDVKGREERKTFLGHTDRVLAVAFFHHGQAILTGSMDQTAIIWDVGTGKEKLTLRGHRAAVEAVAVSPDDTLVATASWDQTIKLWDAETAKEVAVLDWQTAPVLNLFLGSDPVNSVTFSPDGKLLAGGGADGSVRLWDVTTRKTVGILGRHAASAWAVSFSPDGKTLASGSADKTAKLWDVAAMKEVATLVAGSPDSQRITALAYAPEGKFLGVVTGDRTIRVRDAKTGAMLSVLEGHAGLVNCLVFSPDGLTLASGSSDQTVKLWDWKAGKERLTFKGHTGVVYDLAFTPDGTQLASAGGDTAIRLWDLVSGKELATLQGHETAIQALAFAADGRSLASGSADGFIKVWDLVKKTEQITFQGHEGSVWTLAFSTAGALASASEDGTVKIWEAAQGKKRFTLKGHAGGVRALAFTPRGRALVSGGVDTTLRVWDTATGRQRQILHGHKEAVTAVVMHPRGRNMISASQDATLLRWHGAAGGAETTKEPLVAKDVNRVVPIPDRPATSPDGQAVPWPGPQQPQAAGRGWLVLALLGFGTLTGVVLCCWILARRNRRPGEAAKNPLRANEQTQPQAAAPGAFLCPGCGKSLTAKAELAGKKVKCPKCGLVVTVPEVQTSALPRPAARRWAIGITLVAFLAVAGGTAYWVFLRPQQETEQSVSNLDQPFGTQPLPGIAEEGFYDPEASSKSAVAYRWTNGAAKLVVPLHGPPPKALHVHLAIPLPRPRLWIRVNGQNLFEEQVSRNDWAQTFDLSAMNLGTALTLEIVSDTYVPAQQEKRSNDLRTLGVRILAITLLSGTKSYADVPLGVREVAGVMETGFHNPETDAGQPVRWTDGAARLNVPIRGKAPRALAVALLIPDRPKYRVQVTVNGKKLFDDKVEPNRLWSAELPLAGVDLGASARIELDSSTVVPAEVLPNSKDGRKLGVRVNRLILVTDSDAEKK